MARLRHWLFDLARTPVGASVVGWCFAHMHNFLPVQRLYESELVVAFYHPRPSYPVHILIVPKLAIRSVLDLSATHGPLLQAVMTAVQQLVMTLGLEERGFRLVVNGGAYQEVMQVHWHLIAEQIA
jgi:histidine triad (HIT) family protein